LRINTLPAYTSPNQTTPEIKDTFLDPLSEHALNFSSVSKSTLHSIWVKSGAASKATQTEPLQCRGDPSPVDLHISGTKKLRKIKEIPIFYENFSVTLNNFVKY
jgi:hypothetical protein